MTNAQYVQSNAHSRHPLKMEKLGGKSGRHRRSWITLMMDFGIGDGGVAMKVFPELTNLGNLGPPLEDQLVCT